MEANGRTTAWLRDSDGKWSDAGQIKYDEGLDRANYRFVDADGNFVPPLFYVDTGKRNAMILINSSVGDGKADMIWTDKFTGDAQVWYNKGQGTEDDRVKWGGSIFEWGRPVKVYLGSSRGPNMHFPSMGGQDRADMVGVDPTTAHVCGTTLLFPFTSDVYRLPFVGVLCISDRSQTG